MAALRAAAAVAGGALLLLWPAFVNGYPILFSDSGAFLHQTTGPLMLWDKPWVYGPFAWLFHQHVTLWGTVLAQALIVSHLLWLFARVVGGVAPARHLALCAALALLTALPFSVALVMPDVLTPVAILGAALLGWGWTGLAPGERLWLLVLTPVAVASHLAHLPVALALLVLALLLRTGWRAVARTAWPLVGGALIVLAGNLVGHGRASLSPHGSTFLLARLIADGPAARTIAARCPEAGWYLCAFADRLPTDSDVFLWHPDSPVNRAPDGTPIFLGGARIAPEARAIVAETLRREPLAVLSGSLANFARQLVHTRVGDTLTNRFVDHTVRPRLEEAFPPAEVARYAAARQQANALRPVGAALAWLHPLVLLAATPLALRVWLGLHRARNRVALGLFLALLVGLAANALASGALSGPHARYQARVAWLLPAAVAIFWVAGGGRRRSEGGGPDLGPPPAWRAGLAMGIASRPLAPPPPRA